MYSRDEHVHDPGNTLVPRNGGPESFDRSHEPAEQAFCEPVDASQTFLAVVYRRLHCRSEPHDASNVLRAGTALAFLTAANQHGRWHRSISYRDRTDALWATELVSGDRQHVDALGRVSQVEPR